MFITYGYNTRLNLAVVKCRQALRLKRTEMYKHTNVEAHFINIKLHFIYYQRCMYQNGSNDQYG